MEEIVEKLNSLDNVQLRAELLKHGEKVGPVTPTTRRLFLTKLASKMYLAEHPDATSGNGDNTVSQSSANREEECNTSDSVSDLGSHSVSGSMPLTPTGRKGGERNNAEGEESCIFYVVILADSSATPTSASTANEHRVFTEKLEAIAFMKKNAGSRLKVFQNSGDVKQFVAQGCHQTVEQSSISSSKPEEPSSNNLALEAEKSAFRGPKIQDLHQFRKLVEQGNIDAVRTTVWNNPRYLITGADTPVILHEGMRYNLLHIAAKTDQAAIAKLVLDIILDPEFTKLLYSSSHDTDVSRQRRIIYLVDLYLNSPDKGSGETPLHIACKMGHKATVQCLIMFSATDRNKRNKYGEEPGDKILAQQRIKNYQIICSRYKGDQSSSIKQEIQELLKGLCLVPLLRSVDNITLPVVGAPCSPDDKMKLCPLTPTPSLTHNLREPQLTLSAYAGPMSPSKAKEFQKQWMNPRRLMSTRDAQEITNARRSDAEKGYERIGRRLARELCVPWTEYWQFLDAFADFSSQEGLHKLEQHLSKQRVMLAVLNTMEKSSESDSVDNSSTDDSWEDSDEEHYYSCEETSSNERADSNVSRCQNAQVLQVGAEEEEEEEVFEDSLDSFFDTCSYIFGQRLQLKKSSNVSEAQQKDKETKASSESAVDVSEVQEKPTRDGSVLWSYRDKADCEEVEKKVSESSLASDSAHLSDTSISSVDEKCNDSTVDKQEGCKKTEKHTPSKESTGMLDKSFNTVMTELSDDIKTKLIFSPEGKIVPSKRGHVMPDVGLCVGRKVYTEQTGFGRKAKCLFDIILKSRKGRLSFQADVLIHPSPSLSSSDDSLSDESFEDQSDDSRQKVLTDVKMVARNAVVFEYMRHILRPVHLTVGILEPGSVDIAQNKGCITARIVRQKHHRPQQIACYIYGKSACKTDLDVMRAIADTTVDSSVFPAVYSWLKLVTETQQESRDSWPSPAKLRHQRRLSQLHKSISGSPLPVSPLVQGGTLTSTPVSRTSSSAIRCSRDLSPERPAMKTTARAWLFKSPT